LLREGAAVDADHPYPETMAIEVTGRYKGVATLAGRKVVVDLTAAQHVHSARGLRVPRTRRSRSEGARPIL